MFYEIDPQLIKTSDNAVKKRWFRDELGEYDLFVWEDKDGKINKFQFWYQEALLEWSQKSGYKTGTMDPKSGAFINYQSDLYRFHKDLDKDIILLVKNVMTQAVSEESAAFNYIREILIEVANQA
jgi:hypothetical protein